MPRQVIDYGLRRRALLQSLRTGGAFLTDACDADPYLIRAAKFHGEPAGRRCPICDHELVDVHYSYGRVLGPASGSAQSTESLARLAHEAPHFRVYVVEVCRNCLWNHVTSTFVLGHGRVTQPTEAALPRPRSSAEVDLREDIEAPR